MNIPQVKYDSVRDQIQNGDLFAFTGTELFSKLIMRFTGEPISHIGMALWLRFGVESVDRLCLLEAIESGVRIIPVTHTMQEEAHTYWLPLKKESEIINGIGSGIDRNELVGHALELWSDEYTSFLQLLVIMSPFIQKLRRSIGLPPVMSLHRLHCAGTIATAFRKVGYVSEVDPLLTTPGAIWNYDCISEDKKELIL